MMFGSSVAHPSFLQSNGRTDSKLFFSIYLHYYVTVLIKADHHARPRSISDIFIVTKSTPKHFSDMRGCGVNKAAVTSSPSCLLAGKHLPQPFRKIVTSSITAAIAVLNLYLYQYHPKLLQSSRGWRLIVCKLAGKS